jgi:hypothetical protein
MNSAKVYLMKQCMQKHEDPLNLQGLPLVSPPRDGWPAIEAALRSDQDRRRTARYAGWGLAAAASVALAFGLVLQRPSAGPEQQMPDPSLAQAQQAAQDQDAAGTPASTPPAETLEAMIALSQQLERRLRSTRAGTGDLPAGAIVYQVELEDLVAQVDEELSRRPDSLKLWGQRVNLLMDLQQLYENRLRREYRQVASL